MAVSMSIKLTPAVDVGCGELKAPAPTTSSVDLQRLGKSAIRTLAPFVLAATPLVLYASPAAAAVGFGAAEPFVTNLLDSAFFQALSLIFVRSHASGAQLSRARGAHCCPALTGVCGALTRRYLNLATRRFSSPPSSPRARPACSRLWAPRARSPR
jgi:hypothetical protein